MSLAIGAPHEREREVRQKDGPCGTRDARAVFHPSTRKAGANAGLENGSGKRLREGGTRARGLCRPADLRPPVPKAAFEFFGMADSAWKPNVSRARWKLSARRFVVLT